MTPPSCRVSELNPNSEQREHFWSGGSRRDVPALTQAVGMLLYPSQTGLLLQAAAILDATHSCT